MLWAKGLHIVFMVTWFAGLFYLPRLFVYHAETTDTLSLSRFVTMERRLYTMMTIGATGTALFGGWLLVDYAWAAYREMGWLHLKLALVASLLAYHGYLWQLMRAFRAGNNRHDSRFYRIVNEVPSLLLVAIVLLAVAKPF